MKRAVSFWSTVTVLALLQAGEARAAPDEQVFITESRERECRSLRNASGTDGGGFGRESTAVSDGATPALPSLQPIRSTSNRSTRANRGRVCADAEGLRQALEWEQRQASTVEAVWDAVFVPIWFIATNEARSRTFRQEPSELAKRYEENSRNVLLGHPRSEREAFADLAYAAVTSYRASRAALVSERICADFRSFKTGEALGAALNNIDAHIASLKEQLIDEVWSAVDPAMADKLTAYAKAAQPMVWDSSPAFFSDWTPERVERTVLELCSSSRQLNPPAPRRSAPIAPRMEHRDGIGAPTL